MERRDFIKGGVAVAALASAPELAWAISKNSRADSSDPAPIEVALYNRIAFGPRPSDLERFQRRGKTQKKRFESLIEEQLHPEHIADRDCDERIAKAGFKTLHKSVKELWKDHFLAANELRDMNNKDAVPKAGDFKGGDSRPLDSLKAAKDEENDLRKLPAREIERLTWIRAVYSERQLEQVLADFWHNHFNVYGWDNQIAPVLVQYDRDVIRPHLLGNFRQLLEAVATSPAMLFYLDNFINQSGNPNENYARELFELHTLGAENYYGTRDRASVPGFHGGKPVGYVDGDVYEAARCFTGWRVATGKNTPNTGEFEYYDAWHDRFQKIILGHSLKEYQAPMQDGREVLDLLARHPGTAHFIARKLCVRFLSDTPSAALVSSVARVFHQAHAAKDQIRQTLRALFRSAEFQSPARTKIKRPYEFAASAVRALEAGFDPTEDFIRKSSVMGQKLFDWRSPDGYPDSREKWSGAGSLVNRWRFCTQLAHGNVDGIDHEESKQIMSERELGDRLRRIYGKPPSARTLTAVTGFYSQIQAGPKQKNQSSLALALMAPEFQWR